MRPCPAWFAWAVRAALALAALAFLYAARAILTPFVLAFALAYLIEPLVTALQRRGASRSLAILTVFAAVALLFCLIVAVVVPILAADLTQAARVVPRYIERLTRAGNRLAEIYHRLHLPLNIRAALDRLAVRIAVRVENAVGSSLNFLLGLLPGSVILAFVPFIAYYISRDYHSATRAIYRWLERRARPDLLAKAVAVDRVLRAYFRGQALEMVAMMAILTAGLSLLGLEFALLIGIIAGIFNIVPYFGPILGALPALLVAMTRSPWQMAYVVILFVVANQVETTLLAPRIVGSRVGLHPLLVIFVLLLGGKLFGLLGLVMAVPVTAALKVVVSEYLRAAVMPAHGLTSPGASGMMGGDDREPDKGR